MWGMGGGDSIGRGDSDRKWVTILGDIEVLVKMLVIGKCVVVGNNPPLPLELM